MASIPGAGVVRPSFHVSKEGVTRISEDKPQTPHKKYQPEMPVISSKHWMSMEMELLIKQILKYSDPKTNAAQGRMPISY